MIWRANILEGDTLTPGGGIVQPDPQRKITYCDKIACYEGDPVYCNTCKSWGVTKCVPPYRPDINSEGRQVNLDGDLCICNCPTPPRLKALSDFARTGFETHEIAQMPGSNAWLIYAGHKSLVATGKQIVDLSWSHGEGLTPLSGRSRHIADMNLHIKTENYHAGEIVTVTIASDSENKDEDKITLNGKVDANGDIVFRNVFQGKKINIDKWGE